MDVNILRAILFSCNDVWKEIESTDEWKTVETTNRFPITDKTLLSALASSLINILCYKVSPEITQRHEVRKHVIEILREWSRVQGSFSQLNGAFTDKENSLKFVIHILEKHLTDDLLKKTKSVDSLLALYRALILLLPKNACLLKQLHRILFRLAELDLTEESEKLLISIEESKTELEIETSLLEKIYSSQKKRFIEKPLIDAFILTCSEIQNPDKGKQSLEEKLDKLFEVIIHSPLVFQLVSSILKEILVAVNYSQVAVDFIHFVLHCTINRCKNCKKEIVDLYPTNLQSCVILLRISPNSHSESSKNYAINILKEIFLTCNEDALILVSHFPAWLEIFSSFLAKNEYDLPNSQMNLNNTCD